MFDTWEGDFMDGACVCCAVYYGACVCCAVHDTLIDSVLQVHLQIVFPLLSSILLFFSFIFSKFIKL